MPLSPSVLQPPIPTRSRTKGPRTSHRFILTPLWSAKRDGFRLIGPHSRNALRNATYPVWTRHHP
jgi:hypothetical protein